MKIIASIFIGFHASLHLLGFLKAFHLAKVDQLPQPISKTQGAVWLASAILFFVSIILLMFDWHGWWIVAGIGVLCSQSSILTHWKEARYGTFPNLIILLTIGYSSSGCSSGYFETYKSESEKRLNDSTAQQIVSEQDIATLPAPVQHYLRYVGAVGKPKPRNFHAFFEGTMRRKIDGDWLDISAQQYEFFGNNTRLFYIESSMFGIPFDGLHFYRNDSATMQISVASLFQIADAKGDTMTRSETVTLFNDICLLAPSQLTDTTIHWETIDSMSVKATFTNGKHTITAILFFNEIGELIDFSSDDRYLSEDGETYLPYRWSTPVKNYREFFGRKIPTYAEAIWHLPEGDFTYARFEFKNVEYNCTAFH